MDIYIYTHSILLRTSDVTRNSYNINSDKLLKYVYLVTSDLGLSINLKTFGQINCVIIVFNLIDHY